MDIKNQLRQLIREELQLALEEINQENVVIEAREPRASVGKKHTRRGQKFTSAGTIPAVKKRKLTRQQIQNRDAIGKKMLNTLRRGSKSGTSLRQRINGQLKAKGLPTDRKHQYSQIWANASGIVASKQNVAGSQDNTTP